MQVLNFCRFWGWRASCWRYCPLMWLCPLLTGSVTICSRNAMLMTRPELWPWYVNFSKWLVLSYVHYSSWSFVSSTKSTVKSIFKEFCKRLKSVYFTVSDWDDSGRCRCLPEVPAQCDSLSSCVSGQIRLGTRGLGKDTVFAVHYLVM